MLAATAAPAAAGNYVVYLHGRNMPGWIPGGLVWAPADWQHIGLSYNGSERLADPIARAQVSQTLATYCRLPNQCVIMAYSAGVNRLLLGLDDLVRASTPADGVLFIETTASAAGGTEVAAYTSKWFKKLIAVILGLDARVDVDLTTGHMRADLGYIQNRMPVAAYQSAGSRDICESFLAGLIKVCGNSNMPGGFGDGAVPVHSACGYQDTGAHATCCDSAAKYTNMVAEQCALFGQDHAGMLGVGIVEATARFGRTLDYTTPNMVNSAGATASSTFDDIDSTGGNPTIAGVFNISPPDTDHDGRADSCRACDPAGCGHCAEFSIAAAAYPSTCNWLQCTPTVSGSDVTLTSGGSSQLFGISASGSTLRINGTTIPLAGGVTASGYGSNTAHWPRCMQHLDVYVLNATQLDFRTSGGAGGALCPTGSNIITFAGATLFASETMLGSPTTLKMYGNQLQFTATSPRWGFSKQMRVIVTASQDL